MARKKDEKKIELIFRATLQLVLKNGISGVKMSLVAEEANLATGTIYIYFSNKEILMQSLFVYVKKKMNAVLDGFANGGENGFMYQFQSVWRTYIQYIIDNPEEAVFLEQFQRSPYLNNNQDPGLPGIEPFETLLEKGKSEGYLSSIRTDIMVVHMLGGINQLVKSYMGDQIPLTTEDFHEIYDLTWRSIRR